MSSFRRTRRGQDSSLPTLLIILFLMICWPSIPFVLVGAIVWGRVRMMRQGSLLWALAIALRTQRPLDLVVDDFAEDASGNWRRKLRDLADSLRTGVSLPEALYEIPGLLPEEIVSALDVGQAAGHLQLAVEDAAVRFTRRLEPQNPGLQGLVLYFLGVFVVLNLVVSFLMYYIIPKFKKIFMDFGTELPDMTMSLIYVSDMIVMNPLMTFLYFLAFQALVVVSFTTLRASMGYARLIDCWPFAYVRGFFPRLESGEILRNLRLGLSAGKPLDQAFRLVTNKHIDDRIYKRLSRIDDILAEGGDCWISLHEEGFLKRGEAGVLIAAQRAGNLTWALDVVAETVERRLQYRGQVVYEFLSPAVSIFLGAVVGYVVIGLFMPLVKLLNDLS